MTRKDYSLLASVLRSQKPDERMFRLYWDHIVRDLAIALASSNPRFDFDAFYEACGYPAS